MDKILNRKDSIKQNTFTYKCFNLSLSGLSNRSSKYFTNNKIGKIFSMYKIHYYLIKHEIHNGWDFLVSKQLGNKVKITIIPNSEKHLAY